MVDDLEAFVASELANAEVLCARHNVRLTKLRRTIFTCILSSDHPVKAYELIELMRDKGSKLTPPTIYRTLEFLQSLGLVHKIACINAYVPCTCNHVEKTFFVFVCSQCHQVQEIHDESLSDSVRMCFSKFGMGFENSAIEMRGVCENCSKKLEVES